MKRRDFISSHLGRNIGKARTTSSICGWALTSVRFDIRIQLSLIILSHPESTEDADDNEAMDLDDDQYPLLPEDVLEYRLRRRKAVLRQYMAAARRKYHSNPFYVAMDDNHNTGFHNINGRIPWTDIAENPSHHLAKKSRPELDFKLVWNIDSEEAEDRQTADALSDGGEAPAMPETTSDHASDRLGGASDAMALLVSPHSASESRITRRTFLESLSTDVNYAELIHLLNVSPVSRRIL